MSFKSPQLNLINVGSGYLGPAIHKESDISALAKRILDMYDKDKTGHLGHTEVANILMDMYRSFNKSFSPTKYDVDTFSKVMDINRDGKVTQPDLEACIRKFLKCEVDYSKNASSINTATTASTLGLPGTTTTTTTRTTLTSSSFLK